MFSIYLTILPLSKAALRQKYGWYSMPIQRNRVAPANIATVYDSLQWLAAVTMQQVWKAGADYNEFLTYESCTIGSN